MILWEELRNINILTVLSLLLRSKHLCFYKEAEKHAFYLTIPLTTAYVDVCMCA